MGLVALRVLGWRISGTMPAIPRFVIIVAPHTTNWDFPVGVAAKLALRLDAKFLGKHTLFTFPLGVLMRRLGGIPVNRSAPQDVVNTIVAEFATRPRLVLVITPEGTRKRVERWRTGFYHIARAAGVPIVPVVFDWSVKTVRICAPFVPTGDLERDLAALQLNYAGVRGLRADT